MGTQDQLGLVSYLASGASSGLKLMTTMLTDTSELVLKLCLSKVHAQVDFGIAVRAVSLPLC